MARAVLAVALFAFLVASAHAWGPIGHKMTAAIAMKFLSSAATSQLQDILSADGGGDLTLVANWADQVRSDPSWSWSAPLHYIDTPDWECKFNPINDCQNDWCVAGAIGNYSSQVYSMNGNTADVGTKFVTHFTGDIHQPLHVAFASDRGGNEYHGTFFGQSVNLHSMWDTSIIQHRIDTSFNSQDDYTNYLLNGIANMNTSSWTACLDGTNPDPRTCANQWATQTAALACQYAYTDVDGTHIQDGFSLDDAYYQRAYPIVDQQLQRAGVRMAALFNYLLGPSNKQNQRLTMPMSLQMLARKVAAASQK